VLTAQILYDMPWCNSRITQLSAMSRMNKQPSCSRFWWLNRPQTGSTACWPRQKDKLQTWNILSRIADSDTRHRKRLWWRWCRNCIPRQQQQEESVDDYCTQMLKLAKIVQVYLRLYTLVNGLRPETAWPKEVPSQWTSCWRRQERQK